MGTADEEVSPKRCETFVASSREQDGDIAITLYPGATHGFDDPGAKRQKVEANATATADAMEQAVRFFSKQFARRD
jgi:carboxymethylenebutenolidase